MAGPWGSVPGLGAMLPYGAVSAMDYAGLAAHQFHPRQSPVNPAFTHSCILELRKEKSRDAARSRRGKENYEFYELAKMLPLPAAITSQLDKASIIRLTISFLKLKDFSAHGDPPWNRENTALNKKGSVRNRISSNPTLDLFEQHQGTHILQSLDGFAFSLAADGRFLYISETVSIYLGLSQVEMTGSSIFDYIHQQDHSELAEQLGLGLAHGAGANVPSPSAGSDDGSTTSTTNNPDVSSIMSMSSNASYKGLDRSFCVRMKSTLTKRGCHFKSSGYRVVLVLVKLRPQYSFSHTRKAPPSLLGAVGLAIALPPPSVHEIRLETDMFVTRLTFDFRILHCEPRASELLDYTSEELMGKNLYVLCHGEDVNKLRKCHVDLLSKGQVLSQYYRLMNKNGGYIWLQTCATVVCNTKNSDEQSIICVNYVISAKEYSNIVMDCCQLEDDCVPPVKREPLDERDRKSPDNDSSADGPGRGPHRFDSTATKSSPGAKSTTTSSAGSERSPDLRDSYQQGREKRLQNNMLHQRSAGQIHKDGSVLPESQPLTPISTSTPDRIDARTPGSVRSLDSDPPPHVMPTPPATSTKSGRKRKLNASAAAAARANHSTEDLGISGLEAHPLSSCSKRQIIVPNDPMEGGGGTTTVHGSHPATGSVTPVSVGHESGSSPHHSSVEADNSGDSARWRKVNHPSHWDAPGGTSSVKDLEQVMSKHLPGRGDHDHVGGIDFSTDSLLRQQSGSRGSSAIQYAGLQSGPGGLPVSALLRQLCASRESVIRANVQAAAAAAVVAARGASSYYPDMSTVQSALPTPPGSDNYESQFMLASHQKSASSEFSSLVPYPSVSSYDYQPTMTPPSSVSPRDKPTYGDPNVAAAYGAGDASSAGGSATSFRPPQSYLDGPAQPLPLKPQVYGYHPHSSLESQYGNPLTDHSQTQFYPAPHTGFHLYHPTKPSANWYSSTT